MPLHVVKRKKSYSWLLISGRLSSSFTAERAENAERSEYAKFEKVEARFNALEARIPAIEKIRNPQ
jgi:hypothetical protein